MPRVKLTTEVVRRLPRENIDLWDSKQDGLVLRCRTSGTHTYRLHYGRGKWVTLGRAKRLTLDAARIKARSELAKIDAGHNPQAARLETKRGDVTFGQFVDEHYAPWMLAERPRTKQVGRLRGEAFRDFQDVPLKNFSCFHIERWRSARLKAGISAPTVNNDSNALKSALGRAVKWGLLPRHPLADLKKLRQDKSGVVRYLSPAEEQRLRAALTARDEERQAQRERANAWRRERGYAEYAAEKRDHLTTIVLVALNTGLRKGELLALRWPDLDLTRAMLVVRGEGAKSGQTRHVPLNTEALERLIAWHAANGTPATGPVFPGRSDNGTGHLDDIKRTWAPLLASAKITAFRFHDLRHSFASKLVMAGTDLNTVRELLGHQDYETTLRYAHLAPEFKKAAVEKLVTARGA